MPATTICSPAATRAYTPVARTPDGRLRAAPLYYGMLMFAQAGRGALVPARIETGPAGLSAYAVRASDGSLRVCLINKESRATRANIVPGRRFARASVLRLTGAAIDATAGITLGGAAVDEAGQWTPTRRETIEPAGDALMMDLPAASAALVELHA
jgi:glycosyl hydrolase family 79